MTEVENLFKENVGCGLSANTAGWLVSLGNFDARKVDDAQCIEGIAFVDGKPITWHMDADDWQSLAWAATEMAEWLRKGDE